MTDPLQVLRRLETTILERKAAADPSTSHTAKLLAKGPAKCAQKFGEEAVEAVIAAAERDRDGLISESADALYHLLVMLAAQDVPLDEVLAALAAREGRSGVDEKAARSELQVIRANDDLSQADCFRIREIVFVDEQGVSREEELDGQDRLCRHYLAVLGGRPVGAARLKTVELDGAPAAKLQRIAVLKEARGAGAGRALVQAMLEDVEPGRPVILDSQTSAIAFYEPLGFVAEGGEFLDAGIPHRRMVLRAPAG